MEQVKAPFNEKFRNDVKTFNSGDLVFVDAEELEYYALELRARAHTMFTANQCTKKDFDDVTILIKLAETNYRQNMES